jgi:drug/metabolite transporter, DME family
MNGCHHIFYRVVESRGNVPFGHKPTLCMTASSIQHARWFPILCGLGSALGYAITNIGLRHCSDENACLVSAMKALPTAIFMVPWALWFANRASAQTLGPTEASAPVLSPGSARGWLLLSALAGQIGGNVLFQVGLGYVGLAISVPINIAANIVGGAIGGRWLLGEPFTWRMQLSTALMVLATVTLSVAHAQQPLPSQQPLTLPQPTVQQQSVAIESNRAASVAPLGSSSIGISIAGVVMQVVSGFSYGLYGVGLRRSLKSYSTPVVLGFMSSFGLLTLGAIGIGQIGWSGLTSIAASKWWVMIGLGIINATAFVLMAQALKRLSVTIVSLLGASQTAISAAAGPLIFREPFGGLLVVGVLLTVIGLVVLRPMGRSKVERSEASR